MKSITGLIFVFLVGCASIFDKDGGHLKQAADIDNAELEVDSTKKTAISPEVLYLLMTAEIAGQRNQYGVALDGYLQAAKHVDDSRITERAAKIGLFLKNTEKTDEAVSLWLAQDDENLTARKIAVLSALRAGKKSVAVEHLNKILETDPAGFEATLIELTKALGKNGSAELVFDVLDEVSKKHPDQAIVFFVQSLLAGQLNKIDVAKEKVDQALLLQPNWNKALILQAQIAAKEGRDDLARESLEKVLDNTPENNKIRKLLAQILMKTEAYDDAVQLYEDVLESQADDGESQFAIALIYLQQDKEEDALVYLKKLVNNPAWDAQASFYIGRIEFKKENYQDALVWFDKVTQDPYAYDAAMASVSVLLMQKKYHEIDNRIANLAIKYPKQKVNILLLRTEVLNEQNKHQQSFEVMSKALKDYPGHRDILYTRALIAEKLDKLDVVEADLKAIIIKNPGDASALNALGYTLIDRTTRYQDAEVYLLQAIKLKPEEAVIIDSIGWLRFKQGRVDEALKHLRDAYEKQKEGEIAAHLVEVLWSVGNKDEAKEIYDQAVKNTPDNEYLIKIKQRFEDLNN
jgi:tetratricopeptide (TPR) repeat protein